MQIEIQFKKPLLIIFQKDLIWWIEYIQNLRSLYFNFLFKNEYKNVCGKSDLLEHKINFFLQLGLNDFETQLKNEDEAAIVFGFELATLSANNVGI